MKVYFGLLSVLFGVCAPASSATLEEVSALNDVYIAKYSKSAYDNFGFTTINVNISSEIGSKADFKGRINETLLSLKSKGWKPFKVTSNYDRSKIYLILTDSKDFEYEIIDGDEKDLDLISSKLKDGKYLFSCSSIFNYVPDVRLYGFKKSVDDVFLWENSSFSSRRFDERVTFFDELKSFNKNPIQRITEETLISLDSNKKYNIRDIELCNNRWYAFLSARNDYKGNIYSFQSQDLAVLWNKVEDFKSKGINLVDIERGEIEPMGPVSWIGIFSDNPVYKNDIHFKYYLNEKEFELDEREQENSGFAIVDMTISTRGQI